MNALQGYSLYTNTYHKYTLKERHQLSSSFDKEDINLKSHVSITENWSSIDTLKKKFSLQKYGWSSKPFYICNLSHAHKVK